MGKVKNINQFVQLLGIDITDNMGGTAITLYKDRSLAELHLKRYVWENWNEVFSDDPEDSFYKLRPGSPAELKMSDVWEFQSCSNDQGGDESFNIQRQKIFDVCVYELDEPGEAKGFPVDPRNWVDIEPTEVDGVFNLYLKGIDMNSFSSQLRLLQSITHHIEYSDDRLDILDLMGEIQGKYRREYGPTEDVADKVAPVVFFGENPEDIDLADIRLEKVDVPAISIALEELERTSPAISQNPLVLVARKIVNLWNDGSTGTPEE